MKMAVRGILADMSKTSVYHVLEKSLKRVTMMPVKRGNHIAKT